MYGMKKMICALALAGCAATTVPQLPLAENDTCGAAGFADLIGQNVAALEVRLHLGMVRIIRPNTAVTMDYRQERINFVLDEADVITQIACY